MKPLRLALSGSGFKFPAHVGALAAITDAGYGIIEIAGTSGGSIIAALFACGMPIADMRQLALTRDWSNMLEFSLFSLFKGGYCSGTNLLDWLAHATAGKTFRELPIDLHIVASDVSAMAPFEFSKGLTPDCKVALAARASASIPVAYVPISYANTLLQDGGMESNIPVDRLTTDSVPRLGIQLVSKALPLSPGAHLITEIIGRDIDLMLQANDNAHVDLGEQLGAKFAFIETGFASSLDRNMPLEIRQQLYNNGYNGTMLALQTILKEDHVA